MIKSDLRKLWIEGPCGKLEAALRVACPARAAAVVAHPHPLHGGTLHNPVVFHTDRELHRAGFTTLRFNFRGVGSSEGEHDDGRGEVEDVSAAASWLRGVTRGLPFFLVGYSFGSVCSIRHAVTDPKVSAVMAIGLPVRRFQLEELPRLERPLAVVQGTEDEFGTPDEVRQALKDVSPTPELHTIEGAEHLFPGRAPEAGETVARAAERLLSLTAELDR